MSTPLLGREPDPTIAPVRAFFGYPGFDIVYDTLLELREAMIEDDKLIIQSLAKRNARGRAAEQEYLDIKTETFPDGFLRSFNLAHCLPYVFDTARRRHPYEKGLTEVLGEVYLEITTPTRPPVQLYDFPIIDGIAARLNKAKQAVVFKRERAEGLAPLQQEKNVLKAISIAEAVLPGDEVFVEQVERIYRALVPTTVAVQQTMFDRTYLLDDWDGIGFSGIDLGLLSKQ